MDFGRAAAFFLYLGSHMTDAARNATVVLPVAGPGEAEGTFMNFEGRVQRFHQAMQPPGVARPGWMVIHRLLQALDDSHPAVRDVASAFSMVAEGASAFEGLTWAGLGLKGVMTGAVVTAEGSV